MKYFTAFVALLLATACDNRSAVAPRSMLFDNTNLSLSSGSVSLKVGQTFQLTIVHTHNGQAYTGTAVWSSSNSAVATVSSSGLVTAVAPGSATVSATNPSGEQDDGSATITVSSPFTVTGLAFSGGLITGGTISGAVPGSGVTMWDATNNPAGNSFTFTFGGTDPQSISGGTTMIADASGNVTLPSGIGGYPASVGAITAGNSVYFCPNDWETVAGNPAGDTPAFEAFANNLSTAGFAASQGCAGPFTVN